MTVKNILYGLEKRLDNNKMLVQSSIDGSCRLTKFTFDEPTTNQTIDEFIAKTGWLIPNDYRDFLLLHNGAELFVKEYDWGITSDVFFYKLEQIILNNSSPIGDDFYTIGGYVDSLILINNLRLKQGRNDYLFLLDEGSLIDFQCDFKTWINRIILTQGSNYWEWRSKNVNLDTILNEK